MGEDRLDLLRRLTAASPHWALWKSGGDIDSFAPASEWPHLVDAVSGWARETGRGPVLTCRHIEGTLVIVAVEPGTPVRLEQVDIIDYRLLHGTPVVRAAELTVDAAVGADGYRSIAPWAEAAASSELERTFRPRLLAGALAHPVATARRVAAARARRSCPILHALSAERTVSGDLDAWLAEVRRTHRGAVAPEGYR
jgi:hypothetical protein